MVAKTGKSAAKKAAKKTGERRHRINVLASLHVAQDPGFNFKDVYEEHLGIITANACDEGHSAEKVFVFPNRETGEEVSLGSGCKYKPFLFRQWSNLKNDDLYTTNAEGKEILDKAFESIGRNLWKIVKDDLWDYYTKAEASTGIKLDLTKVPPKSGRKEFAEKFGKNVSKAIAIQTTERKADEEKRRAEAEAKRRGVAMGNPKDPLYEEFRKVEFKIPKDEYDRRDMVEKYRRWGWTDRQRGKVRAMLANCLRVGGKPATPRPTVPAPVTSGRTLATMSDINKSLSAIVGNVIKKHPELAKYLERPVQRVIDGQPISKRQRAFLHKAVFEIGKIQDDRVISNSYNLDALGKYINNLPVYEN